MSEVDLSALRMEPSSEPPRRPLGPRLAAGLLVVVGVAVALSFLWPLLRPARRVAAAAVRPAGTGEGAARTSTAEAAGWVEPDPFPIVVRPLVAGVLFELPVLEGTVVKKGETVIGRLRSAELEAARDRAVAALAEREAELGEADARRTVAASLLDQRGEPRRVEAAATETLRAEEARLADRRGALETARADRDARAAELEGQENLRRAGGSYPVAIARAEAALRAADATIAGLEREIAALEARVAASTELLAIARELREQPRALEGALAEATAAVRRATAARDAARVEVAVATRELSWCEVTAPADGVVMKLLAAPGAEVGPTGTGIVAIYDPARLQARVDVPLASAAGVAVGQDVEIRSEVLAGRSTRGTVIRVQHESDLLKNTLQVKVRLIEPDPILRPETLCRARFLAPTGAAGTEITRFRVPRAAVRDGYVFVIDPGGARRVPVETIGEEGGDVVVTGALSVTHRVALEEVAEGERVEEAGR